MKFTCSVEINDSRDKVVKLFKDPSNLKEWQEGFVSMDSIRGAVGEVGAKTKFVYDTSGGRIELIETIQKNDLPEEFVALYEAKQMTNTMANKFSIVNSDKTRWEAQIDYLSFNGFVPKLMAKFMPGMFKKQTQKWLDNFKEFAENQN
ncbi:MAG: SRPBCC family protein [Chitinophagales bacterium]|nr:SRPBCC family protein [Chitinophagales bacterium]